MSLGLLNYWIIITMMMAGLYTVIAKRNLVKKLIGLAVFQTAVVMMYVSMGVVTGGTAPIVPNDLLVGHGGGGDHGGEHPAEAAGHATEAAGHAGDVLFSNPVPHVLMLTAIVVGVATLAVGLGLVVRIWEAYGTIEEDEILSDDKEIEFARSRAPREQWVFAGAGHGAHDDHHDSEGHH